MGTWWAGRVSVALMVLGAATVLLTIAVARGQSREAAVIVLLAAPLARGLWVRLRRRLSAKSGTAGPP